MRILPKFPGQLYFRGLAMDRKLADRGWNQQNLKQVYRTFSGIAHNFALLTGRPIPHDVMLMKQCEEHGEAAVGLDNETIYVFLLPGPRVVGHLGTLALTRELSEEFFENVGLTDHGSFLEKASIPMFYSRVQECAASLEYYLSIERGLPADQDNIREIIEVISSALALRAMKFRMSSLLLRPRVPSRSQIEGQIKDDRLELEQEAAKLGMEEDLIFSWRTVGFLSLLSLLARKSGCVQSALECQGRLWDKFGEDLSVIELGNMIGGQDMVRTLQGLHRVTLPEFNILFNGLLPICDLYFDATESILRRLSAEKPTAS